MPKFSGEETAIHEDLDDFPTVGLTMFDLWMTQLYLHMVACGFLAITDYGSLDRDHWKQYYDSKYTPEQAFNEDLTCYGD